MVPSIAGRAVSEMSGSILEPTPIHATQFRLRCTKFPASLYHDCHVKVLPRQRPSSSRDAWALIWSSFHVSGSAVSIVHSGASDLGISSCFGEITGIMERGTAAPGNSVHPAYN